MEVEIILKEEEKHRLKYVGVLSDLQDVIEQIKRFSMHPVSGTLDKKAFLNTFYTRILRYGEFIQAEKCKNKKLKLHLFHVSKEILSHLRKISPARLDNELKIRSEITVAYHLSDLLFDEIYSSFYSTTEFFETPGQLNHFFDRRIADRYPLSFSEYLSLLQQEDHSFWNLTCIYIRQIISIVSNSLLNRGDNVDNKDLIQDNSWSDAYEILKDRLLQNDKTMPVFKDGTDFRNYVIQICRYRVLNLNKKYGQKEFLLDDTGLLPDIQEENNVEEEMTAAVKELDINTDNPYEVAYAVSIILLNNTHPLHTPLIEGLEEKVEILIGKVISGLSYKEIIEDLYGSSLSERNFQLAVNKARKDYERVRKVLVDRLILLIEEKNIR